MSTAQRQYGDASDPYGLGPGPEFIYDEETRDATRRASEEAFEKAIKSGCSALVANVDARHARNQARSNITNAAFDKALREAMRAK